MLATLRSFSILRPLRRALRHHLELTLKPVRSDVRQLSLRVEELEAALRETSARAAHAERQAAQLRLTITRDEQDRPLLAELPRLLDRDRVVAHVRRAILRTPLLTDPYPHMVVDELLPPDLYRVLLKAIPSTILFGDRDTIKQNARIPLEFGPALQRQVWEFMDTVIARDAIQPAVMDVFAEPLRAHSDRIFGEAYYSRMAALPQAISGGRVMLRRPGYYLAPHRDPKRAMVTCLLYLAKRRDNESYGTEIYRVRDDRESSFTQTYYPEEDGRACELVKVVPFRANSMLVFLNSYGAHGARIPADAPAETERYAYQFYIGPDGEALDALIKDLPPERQAMWRAKSS